MNYLAFFEETKQKLIAAGAKITREETELELTRGELEYLEPDFNIQVSDELFELYSQLNGLEFWWEYQGDGFALSGYINLHCFEDLIERENEDKLWADWYEEEDLTEMKQHYLFETLHGTDNYVTLRMDEQFNHKMHFAAEGMTNHGGAKKLPEIPLSLENYFRVTMGYFGLSNLRYHLHKPGFYKEPLGTVPELHLLSKMMPEFEAPEFILLS